MPRSGEGLLRPSRSEDMMDIEKGLWPGLCAAVMGLLPASGAAGVGVVTLFASGKNWVPAWG